MVFYSLVVICSIMIIWQYNTTFSSTKVMKMLIELPDEDSKNMDEVVRIMRYHLSPSPSHWFGFKHWFVPYHSPLQYERLSDFQ